MQTYVPFTARQIKPRGWLRRQLTIQAEGLGGQLDRIWPDVRDSAWIGGSREGWERVPYWLDGFVPLAYLLEDDGLIRRAKRYIDAIVAAQQPDGWLCPCPPEQRASYDTWALQLITKTLTVYHECSGDERIPDVLYRALKNYHDLLADGTLHLFDWGKFRWFECFVAIRFVYARCREPWLLDLARLLHEQGEDYTAETDKWQRPINRWRFETHIVNIAMMLRSEALTHDLLGLPYTDTAARLHDILEKYNGTPVGLFTGDECLSGLSPIQGTELCAVVEQMYSYEWLYACTGEEKWAERLELLAFNALPGTFDDRMQAHQYLQMSNQTSCEALPGRPLARTDGPEANVFGLEPNYGCCTANFHQGWPKLALSAFLSGDGVLHSALLLPCELDAPQAHIRLETDYPFLNSATYTVEARQPFTLTVRVPSFAEEVTVNGAPAAGSPLSFTFSAGERRQIVLSFSVRPRFIERPYGLRSVRCGSLVFSVPVPCRIVPREYERDGVPRKFPYCDYDYLPDGPFGFAFCGQELTVERRAPGAVPFSSQQPPVTVDAAMQPIDWGLEDGFERICAKLPHSTVPTGAPRTVRLVPYACAKLRMTELPEVDPAHSQL